MLTCEQNWPDSAELLVPISRDIEKRVSYCCLHLKFVTDVQISKVMCLVLVSNNQLGFLIKDLLSISLHLKHTWNMLM